jgi:transitional endoplasmic reticulum ATPase
MSSEFIENVREKVKEIQQEVCIKEEILQKIVAILLSIKEGKFPSKRPPRGLLFYGPPGTGKTLLMKVLAKKLRLSEPIIIRGPEIISPYYGKSEARLREAFEEAKEKAEKENLAIIFIDEIDSIAPRRDQTRGELEPRLVGQLLSLMDGLEREVSKGHVIVIGSTNRPEALDPALRRPGRFDLEIEFDPPNVDERKRILEILLNEYAPNKYKDINLDEIAEQTIGFTGADLLQLLNESLLLAALEGRDYITQKDLLKAKDNIKPSALREFYMEKPKNRINEIENKERVKNIAQQFVSESRFKAVLLRQDISLADKIASTIASLVCEKLSCPYIVVRANWFKSKWFGEMEKSIRELFERIKRLQPCIVYIKLLDAIAPKVADEHLHGAILEILEYLTEFRDSNVKVLLLCSAANDIAPQIEEYFETLELKSAKQT